jgi:putative DNA primase/helicase
MLSAGEIAHALGGKRTGSNSYAAKCPAHEDRTPSLSLTDTGDGLTLWHCHAGCSQTDVRDALIDCGLWEAQGRTGNPPKPKAKPPEKPSADNGGKARWLWQRSRPIQGTIAEVYLRCERVISCPLPATLRFLPGNDRHPPSMIAPFVIPDEVEPGKLAVNADHVAAVHITRLTADGHKHPDDPNKVTIGSAPGVPIVLAPMNDLLGLAVAEGIEDALSVHQATGLGAWAAGSAGRMPALADAVPDYADLVTIFADANKTGESNSALLAERLKVRGIHAEVLPLAEAVR